MNQWCTILWLLVSGCAERAANAVSWLLDNVDWFKAWFEPLHGTAKKLIFAGTTLLIGFGAWSVGHFLFGCSDGWEPFIDVAYVILMAAIGYLSGKSRYERARRKAAEGKVLKRKWE